MCAYLFLPPDSIQIENWIYVFLRGSDTQNIRDIVYLSGGMEKKKTASDSPAGYNNRETQSGICNGR